MPMTNTMDGRRQRQRLERVSGARPVGLGRNASPAHPFATVEWVLKVDDDLTSPFALRVETRALEGDRYALPVRVVDTDPEWVQIDQLPWRSSYFSHGSDRIKTRVEDPSVSYCRSRRICTATTRRADATSIERVACRKRPGT